MAGCARPDPHTLRAAFRRQTVLALTLPALALIVLIQGDAVGAAGRRAPGGPAGPSPLMRALLPVRAVGALAVRHGLDVAVLLARARHHGAEHLAEPDPALGRARRGVSFVGPPAGAGPAAVCGRSVRARATRPAPCVFDLAMRIGEGLLTNGAAASEVTATVLRVTSSSGLRNVSVQVTFNEVTISYLADESATPFTRVRSAGERTQEGLHCPAW